MIIKKGLNRMEIRVKSIILSEDDKLVAAPGSSMIDVF